MTNNLPTALEMKELTRTPADNSTILQVATLKAIYTACGASLTSQTTVTTAAISTGSATEEQLQKWFSELNQAGFTLVLSATTFTVSWPR